jgi:soluble cytochrome b562
VTSRFYFAFEMLKRMLAMAIAASFLSGSLRAEEDEQGSPVDLLMEQVSRDMKKLSRQFDNPASRDSSLALADELISATTKAKGMQPQSVGEMKGMTPEEYMALYHQGMDALLEQFHALKKALEADEIGLAEAAMEQAYSLREEYHRKLLP